MSEIRAVGDFNLATAEIITSAGLKINIKSTAVLFKNNGRVFVKFFYSLFLLFIGLLAFYSSKSFLSFIVIIPIIIERTNPYYQICFNKKLNSKL